MITKYVFWLFTLCLLSALTGCEKSSPTLATYSGPLMAGTEEVSLRANGKYKQTYTYQEQATPFPFKLPCENCWRLVDTETGKPVPLAEVTEASLKHTDVELTRAIGPAPFRENTDRYDYSTRTIPAGQFQLLKTTGKTP